MTSSFAYTQISRYITEATTSERLGQTRQPINKLNRPNIVDKNILIAASPSISAQAIRYHLNELPSTWKENIEILQGNLGLRQEAPKKWPSSILTNAKSRSEIRKLLETTAHLLIFWDGEGLTKLLFEARILSVPTKVIPVEVTKVVNKKTTDDFDIYIGRGSIWGNPFAIGHGDGPDREEVIKKYQEYFEKKLSEDTSFKKGVLGLRGMRLACFCKPEACHGDVIAAYLDRLPKVEDDTKEVHIEAGEQATNK